MFSDNKSELSIPVVGFMLLGFAALFAGIAMLNTEWEFLDGVLFGVDSVVFVAAGILLMLISLFSFKQVFLIEGMTFGVFGLFLFVLGYGTTGGIAGLESLGVLGIVLSVVALIVAAMSYRVGDIYVLLISIFAIAAFLPMYFASNEIAMVVSSVGFLVVAGIAIAYAVLDWMLVQDVASDIAEYMYGDDECECGCGCEEHSD